MLHIYKQPTEYIGTRVSQQAGGDLIFFLCTQATDEIQRLRRQVSQARSPSPSRAASAVLTRVESERDEALAELRRTNTQRDNLEDKFKVRLWKLLNYRSFLKSILRNKFHAMQILDSG